MGLNRGHQKLRALQNVDHIYRSFCPTSPLHCFLSYHHPCFPSATALSTSFLKEITRQSFISCPAQSFLPQSLSHVTVWDTHEKLCLPHEHPNTAENYLAPYTTLDKWGDKSYNTFSPPPFFRWPNLRNILHTLQMVPAGQNQFSTAVTRLIMNLGISFPSFLMSLSFSHPPVSQDPFQEQNTNTQALFLTAAFWGKLRETFLKDKNSG